MAIAVDRTALDALSTIAPDGRAPGRAAGRLRRGGRRGRDQGLRPAGPGARRDRRRTGRGPRPAAAAAVFTPNAFAAAPVRLSQAPSRRHRSGRRWTVRLGDGRDLDERLRQRGDRRGRRRRPGDRGRDPGRGARDQPRTRRSLLSTGIIGTRLPLDIVRSGVAAVAPTLAPSDDGLAAAAEALRTTDSRGQGRDRRRSPCPIVDGLAVRSVRVTGIAKGVGMIHPRMATMLSIVLTDATVDPATLHGLLRPAAARTWDQLSVDGDTSTNDTVFLLASGAAGAARSRPGRATRSSWAGRSRQSPATSPASRRPTARAPRP